MRCPFDAVKDRVPHDDVWRSHIDFGAEDMGPILEFTCPHPCKQVQILLDGAVSIRALLARLGQGAAVLPDLIGTQVSDIGLAVFDQLDGKLIELLEIVGGIEEAIFPVEAQPVDIVDDRFNIFEGFAARVRIIHPQIAGALILCGDAEIEADGFGMPDMEISVRLGREAGGHTALEPVRSRVFFDDLPYKIRWG